MNINMRTLRNLDYFRKYTDDLRAQTTCGAFLSLLTILLIILFSVFELCLYFTPALNREVTLIRTKSHNLTLNIDIILQNAPCESIYFKEVQIYGERLFHPKDIESLIVRRIDSSSKEISDDYISVQEEYSNFDKQMQLLLTELLDAEGCHISGNLTIDKSPNTLHILVNWETEEMIFAQRLIKGLDSKITMNHKLLEYSFGDKNTIYSPIFQLKTSNINTCDYFMKLIPQTYKSKEIFISSVYFQCSEEVSNDKPGHQLTFMHEVSSVGIKYTEESINFLVLLVSLAAIIGGAYVIVDLINRCI